MRAFFGTLVLVVCTSSSNTGVDAGKGNDASMNSDGGSTTNPLAGFLFIRASANQSPNVSTYAAAEVYKAANATEQDAINVYVKAFLESTLLTIPEGTCGPWTVQTTEPPGLPKPMYVGTEIPIKDTNGTTFLNLGAAPNDGHYFFSGTKDLFGFKGTLEYGAMVRKNGIPIAMGLHYFLSANGGSIQFVKGMDGKIAFTPTPPAGTTVIARFPNDGLACKGIGADIQLGFMRIPQVSLETKFGLKGPMEVDFINANKDPVTIDFGTTIQNWSFESLFTSTVAATYYF